MAFGEACAASITWPKHICFQSLAICEFCLKQNSIGVLYNVTSHTWSHLGTAELRKQNIVDWRDAVCEKARRQISGDGDGLQECALRVPRGGVDVLSEISQ